MYPSSCTLGIPATGLGSQYRNIGKCDETYWVRQQMCAVRLHETMMHAVLAAVFSFTSFLSAGLIVLATHANAFVIPVTNSPNACCSGDSIVGTVLSSAMCSVGSSCYDVNSRSNSASALVAPSPASRYQRRMLFSYFDSSCRRYTERPRAETVRLKSTAGDGSVLPADDRVDGGGGRKRDEEDDIEGVVFGAQAVQVLAFWRNRQPSADLPVSEVVGLLMAALQKNNDPQANDGLRTVFNFSSAMCRRAVGSTVESFISQARASVFAATLDCTSFSLDPLQTVGDRLATQVVNVTSSDGRKRRFLWTLERQRRPPDTGKWLIYGVVSSDVDGALTMEG